MGTDTVAAIVDAVVKVQEVTGVSLIDYMVYILAGVQVASIIVRVTPTKKDDKAYGKIMKVLLLVFKKGNEK